KRCNDDARVNRVANDSIGPGVHHMMTFLERDGTRPELTEVNARPPAKQETGASQRGKTPTRGVADAPKREHRHIVRRIETKEQQRTDHGEDAADEFLPERGAALRARGPECRGGPADDPEHPEEVNDDLMHVPSVRSDGLPRLEC